jgi:hypothetical protein
MRAQVAANTGADPDRHIMSQRLIECVSADRKRWSSAGNDHARPRSGNRHIDGRETLTKRPHDEPRLGTAALQARPAMRTSCRAEYTVGGIAQVQSP